MKLKDIFESLNSKAKNTFEFTFSEKYKRIYFETDDNSNLYGIDFRFLNLKEFKLEDILKKLYYLKIVSITFGNIDEQDNINYKQVKGSAIKGLKVFSAVRNIILDFYKKENIDIIIFSAKQEDGVYENRLSAYSVMASNTAKQHQLNLKQFSDNKVTYFILLREDIKLSSKEEIALKKEIIEKISFKENLKLKK